MIKSISVLTRKAGLSHKEFVSHWLEVHAPLAYAVPGLRRYVQSHIVGERTRPDIPTTDVEIDGIAETWYDDWPPWSAPMPLRRPKHCTRMAPCLSAGSRASLLRRR